MSFPSMSAVACASILACLYQGQLVLASRPQEGFGGSLSKDSQESVHVEDSVHRDVVPKVPAIIRWKVSEYGDVLCAPSGPSHYDTRTRLEIATQNFELLKQLRGKSPYVASLIGDPAVFEKEGYALVEGFSDKDRVQWLGREVTLRDRRVYGVDRESLIQKAIYFWQLVKGMRDLHDQGVVHMDISLENTRVNCDFKGTTDTGGASVCYAALANLGNACRENPEKCKPSMDVYKMGMLLHNLFVNRPPSFTTPEGAKVVRRNGGKFDVSIDRTINLWLDAEQTRSSASGALAKKVADILAQALAPPPSRITSEKLLAEAGELLKIIVPEDWVLRTMLLSPAEYGARRPRPPCLDMKQATGTGVCKDAPLKDGGTACLGYAWEDPSCQGMFSMACRCCHCENGEGHFRFLLQYGLHGCKPKKS